MLVGVREQLLDAAGDHVAGGLVAADEDEQGLLDERVFIERMAVDLGVDQDADEVVGGSGGAAVGQDRVDVLVVLHERLHCLVHGVGVG